jgi:hypothetical protein
VEREQLDKLKQDVFSDDWEKVKDACHQLGEIGGEEVFQFLLELLKLPDSGIRNRAALALRTIADSRAVKPLLDSIRQIANHNYNGTMVYALETLDCGDCLKELFQILFYESYEAKVSAMAILDEQIFEFTSDDLNAIQSMWDTCKANPALCPDFEGSREEIEHFVEGFMAYLSDEQ